jgi:hypothetical protein
MKLFGKQSYNECDSAFVSSRNSNGQSLVDNNVDNLVASDDLVDHFNALGYFSKASVHAVEMCRVFTAVANKELGAASVLARVRHRKHSAIVMLIPAACFAIDLPTRSARSAASWATTLNNKIGNDSMKVQSFIETLLCEFAKISDGIWCVGVEELDDHITLGCFDGCC